MTRIPVVLLALAALAPIAHAQHPLIHVTDGVEIRFARSQPVLSYTLRVDSADFSGFDVELKIRNTRDTFHLAMAAHPEYDDRYWRFLRGLSIEGRGAAATIVREDSSLWRVSAPGGEATVRYRLELPPAAGPRRQAWQPFLAPTGGLVGGPHSFLYIVGASLAPSHVTLELPAGWETATGLEPTSDPRTFYSPTIQVLIDSPMLVGRFRTWRWKVDGVPHRLVYWPMPNGIPFDTAALVSGTERISREAVRLFGRAPYRDYSFLLQDGAVGALEHLNSVTLGAPSEFLSKNSADVFPDIGHEFMHTWNLMRIRPMEYRDVDYRTQPPVSGLWWSEGLSVLYGDLLQRRSGVPTSDSTRTARLERQLLNYLANPGNTHFSAERVSRVAYNADPGALGDYTASTHLQGEVLGTMLDLIVRDATHGTRSMDDVMRAMLEGFSGVRGFNGYDVERTVAQVCGCKVAGFFAAHVRGGTPLDFNRYLALAGLRASVTWSPASNAEHQPVPDLRVRAWLPSGRQHPSLLLFEPASAWGRAGLHTGDQLVTINGAPVPTPADFRSLLARVRLGDTLVVEVMRGSGAWRTQVIAVGYNRPSVRIEDLPGAGERQRAIRAAWRTAQP